MLAALLDGTGDFNHQILRHVVRRELGIDEHVRHDRPANRESARLVKDDHCDLVHSLQRGATLDQNLAKVVGYKVRGGG